MSLRGEGEDVVQIRAQVIAAQMTSVTVDVIVGIQIVAAGVDVGGVHGYAEFLEALADPGHPEHTRYLEWVGGAFDPEAFDPQGANERLAAHARAKRSPVWGLPPDGERYAAAPLFDPSVFDIPATAEHEMTAITMELIRSTTMALSYSLVSTRHISTTNFILWFPDNRIERRSDSCGRKNRDDLQHRGNKVFGNLHTGISMNV